MLKEICRKHKTRTVQTLILHVILVLCVLSSCNYAHEEDNWMTTNAEKVDSIDFQKKHHYWKGFNFIATDSLRIASRPPFAPQLIFTADSTILIGKNDAIIIEDIKNDTTSATPRIWVKIAAAKSVGKGASISPGNFIATTGWVEETKLRENVVPDTPISKIIHALGSHLFKTILLFAGTGAVILSIRERKRFRRIPMCSAFYIPFLFVLNNSIVLHRSIWHFIPETWVEYYYEPSLNPLSATQPFIINLFIIMFWILVVLALAVADSLRRYAETPGQLLIVICRIIVENTIVFALLAVMCPFAILYPVSVALSLYLIFKARNNNRYQCGNCGQPLHKLGKCPNCGANNV